MKDLKKGFKETDIKVLHLNELHKEDREDREHRMNARNWKKPRKGFMADINKARRER